MKDIETFGCLYIYQQLLSIYICMQKKKKLTVNLIRSANKMYLLTGHKWLIHGTKHRKDHNGVSVFVLLFFLHPSIICPCNAFLANRLFIFTEYTEFILCEYIDLFIVTNMINKTDDITYSLKKTTTLHLHNGLCSNRFLLAGCQSAMRMCCDPVIVEILPLTLIVASYIF